MDPHTLKRLNQKLADLGTTPDGGPYFKWSHCRDLKFPMLKDKTAGGVILPVARYEWVPQVDLDAWVVAAWDVPPTYAEWCESFGKDFPYVCHDMYYASSLILPEGYEPNDAFTDIAVGYIKKKRETVKDPVDIYRSLVAGMQANKNRLQSIVDDFVDDAKPAFGNSPGERGHHVVFGGI